MEVACGRCYAEYEFDDALLSEAGTVVRCTSCGFQFRVFPQHGQHQQESWTLHLRGRGATGQVYDSLHELQQAIVRGEILRGDLLARGDAVPRPVQSIVELAPFLAQPRSAPPPRVGAPSVPPLSSETDGDGVSEAPLPPPRREHWSSSSELLTPTPSHPPRVSVVGSEPASRAMYRGRGARGVWILLVVIGGAGAFLVATAKDKFSFMDALKSAPQRQTDAPHQKELLERAQKTQADAEVAWLRVRLAEPGQLSERQTALRVRLAVFEAALAQVQQAALSGSQLAQLRALRVHAKRMAGKLEEARAEAFGDDREGLIDPYVLSMLDLADKAEDRPYGVILARLKEASTGERGRFLVRSAYIYAEILAGHLNQAQADLNALAQLSGGTEAPLYGDLQRFWSLRASAVEAQDLGAASVEEPEGRSSSQSGKTGK